MRTDPQRAQVHEDEGYIKLGGSQALRKVKEVLRSRRTHTFLRTPPTDEPDPRVENAAALAKTGASMPEGPQRVMRATRNLALSGLKLSKLTQSLAYKAIRQKKSAKVALRPRTSANLEEIRDGLEEACERRPDDKTLWNSLQSVHILRECRSFMWMTVHDGYMVGTHWNRPGMGPELVERAICSHPRCQCVESMDHILLRCEAAGQAVVWDLLANLWELAKLPSVPIRLGTTLGAACLWIVLCTESLHLIWKLRCERVIRNEGEEHSRAEVENRWHAALTSRLALDRRTAARASGKKALTAERVARIWGPVIEGADGLPDGWVLDSGVLVGIKRGR
ncbi:hypothetical protein C8Q76DRAFT_764616 [Earliella scabrosa]|nr:hypothetical protein C8Q76DRAFT_764616 [Earliella scabrosa]